jgi:acyl-CoA dehydrogenase
MNAPLAVEDGDQGVPAMPARRSPDAFDPAQADKASWLEDAARAVACVAARHASDVDREARFPAEALDAMRQHRMLGAMAPRVFGGESASLEAIASACRIIGQACSSAAMVFAMHQIQVACLIEHQGDHPWQRNLLRRLTADQWLVASATSEDAVGGNLRNSSCAIDLHDGGFELEKLTPTISYGAAADAILVTARRTPESPAGDQALIVIAHDDYTLTRRGGWDTFGMRGTCTESFVLRARGRAEQILPAPFSEIADKTMVPVSHILWAALWTGIADDALNRARSYFRRQAQDTPGVMPPAGRRLAEALALLQMMSSRLSSALAQYRRAPACASWSEAMSIASDMNTLKTSVSTMALQVVHHAMMICGMAAYKNGTPFSLGRHLRDLYSAPLMINNDRIEANTANLLLAQRSASQEFQS